jgi:hypothetical protein
MLSATRLLLMVATASAACAASLADARSSLPVSPRAPRPFRVAVSDSVRRIDVNRINMFAWNTGQLGVDPRPFDSGLFFPKGTDRSVVFASGPWLGGKLGSEVRVAIAEYRSEYAPGPMVGTTPADPTDPRHRVYKIARWTGNAADSTHVVRPAFELAADPNLDPLVHHAWSEYLAGAAPFGAPTRTYRLPLTATPDPTDSADVVGPDVAGDQMLWCVYNDADPANHVSGAGATAPLGVEIQQTLFAYNSDENLRNTVFMRLKIIHKGGGTLDSLYASLWSDPDVGGATDDVTGCDTTRGLGFAYNARGLDQFYGDRPPAVGYTILRGPSGLTAGDTLGLTSFTSYVGGNDPAASIESYRLMRGLLRGGDAPIDPTTGQPTRFAFLGDPVRGTGWLDPDRTNKLMLVSSGPFRMATSDTQVVEAAIVVGQGADHLSSVGALYCGTDRARRLFQNRFDPSRLQPAAPCSTEAAYVVTNCPRTTAFWSAECAFGGGLIPGPQLTQIAVCVDSLSTLFDWPPGTDLAQLAAVIDPPGTLDLRQRARREYAAMMASDCAGRLGIRTISDEPIWLNRLTELSCSAPRAGTIGEMTQPARVIPEFLGGTYENFDLTHRRALDGVDVGLPSFMGGAGTAETFLGSSLDPVVDAATFVPTYFLFYRGNTQKAYRYLRLERQSDGTAPPQGRGYLYGGFVTVPFTCWEVINPLPVSPASPAVASDIPGADGPWMEVAFVERVLTDDLGTILPPAAQPATFDSTWAPDASVSGGHEYLFAVRRLYLGTPRPEFELNGAIADGSMPVMYALASRLRSAADVIDDRDRFVFSWGRLANPGADSMLVALESQPLADRAVQDAYEDLIACLAPINDGAGIGVTCTGTVPQAITVVSVEKDSTHVLLTWITAVTPLTASVERRREGDDWVAIGQAVAGPEGLIVFDDTAVIQGARYDYRLAVDIGGGRVEYFGAAQVDVPGRSAFAFFGARPNPATQQLVLSFSLASRAPARLELIDVTGRRVLARDLDPGAGPRLLDLGSTTGFRAGIYLVRIIQSGLKITGKVAVVN